jgi:hypothetical protein
MRAELASKTGSDTRVALCLGGQMRTFRECYGYLVENVLEPLDPDVFVHTEETVGITNRMELQASGRGDDRGTVTRETIERLYDPKAVEITPPFSAADRREFEGVRVPSELIEAEPDHWQGNIPNFYSIYRCNELKREWETEHGFRYDVVIRMRPDLLVPAELPAEVLSNPEALWHTHVTSFQVSDKLAVSNSENMDYYASVWEELGEYWADPLGDSPERHRVGERLLKQHLDRSEIDVRRFDVGDQILRSRTYIEEQARRDARLRNRLPSKRKLAIGLKHPDRAVAHLLERVRENVGRDPGS